MTTFDIVLSTTKHVNVLTNVGVETHSFLERERFICVRYQINGDEEIRLWVSSDERSLWTSQGLPRWTRPCTIDRLCLSDLWQCLVSKDGIKYRDQDLKFAVEVFNGE